MARTWACATFFGWLCCAVPAAADDSTAAYDEAVAAATDEFQRGNFEEAHSRFLKAHRIYANARTLRALGMTEYELKRYVDAVEHLEQALTHPERALTAAQRDEVRGILRQARGYVSSVRLRVSPAHAEVLIDGAPVAMDAERRVRLAVGEYLVSASATGYMSGRRRIVVVGGEDSAVTLRLQPVPTAADAAVTPAALAPAGTPPQRDEHADRDGGAWYGSWWFWTGVGVVAVAAGATAVVLSADPGERVQDASGGSIGMVVPLPPASPQGGRP